MLLLLDFFINLLFALTAVNVLRSVVRFSLPAKVVARSGGGMWAVGFWGATIAWSSGCAKSILYAPAWILSIPWPIQVWQKIHIGALWCRSSPRRCEVDCKQMDPMERVMSVRPNSPLRERAPVEA